MNNQHAGLSQVLADQHITQRCQQAAHALLAAGPVASLRRTANPSPQQASVDRSEATLSKRARALTLGAMLAAINLVGLTAVAHAQATQTVSMPGGWPPQPRARVGHAA
jgi:hypothetical protein